ncbi:hypothetical protein D3C71_2145350 [compost metagenome]
MKRLTVCMVFLLNSDNGGCGAAKKRPLHGGIGGQGLSRACPDNPPCFQQISAIGKCEAFAHILLHEQN